MDQKMESERLQRLPESLEGQASHCSTRATEVPSGSDKKPEGKAHPQRPGLAHRSGWPQCPRNIKGERHPCADHHPPHRQSGFKRTGPTTMNRLGDQDPFNRQDPPPKPLINEEQRSRSAGFSRWELCQSSVKLPSNWAQMSRSCNVVETASDS